MERMNTAMSLTSDINPLDFAGQVERIQTRTIWDTKMYGMEEDCIPMLAAQNNERLFGEI